VEGSGGERRRNDPHGGIQYAVGEDGAVKRTAIGDQAANGEQGGRIL